MGFREFVFVLFGLIAVACLGVLCAFGILEDIRARFTWKTPDKDEQSKS